MSGSNADRGPTSMTYSDQMGSRSRKAWLLLVKGEEVKVFGGETIPAWCVVRGTDYRKNGMWSHSTYRLELAPGVRAISGNDGWETGRFAEGLRSAVRRAAPIDRWTDFGEALGISVPSAMTFLRAWRPRAADRFDEVDVQMNALDDAADAVGAQAEIETVTVSFGSPTRRERSEGFWENPKQIPGHAGEIRLIDPSKGWEKENISVHGVVGSVLSATHAAGHGGGYVTVTLALVPGTEVQAPELEVAHVSTPVEEPKVEVVPVTTFAYVSRKDFRCTCGGWAQLTGGEFVRYNAGESIVTTCGKCSLSGEVRKG